MVAEGYKPGTTAIVNYFKQRKEDLGFKVRVTVLGHVQRGGAPTAFDRILATRLGAAAVDELFAGTRGAIVGLVGNEIRVAPLEETIRHRKGIDLSLLDLASIMEQ